jgi:hypothetical protein
VLRKFLLAGLLTAAPFTSALAQDPDDPVVPAEETEGANPTPDAPPAPAMPLESGPADPLEALVADLRALHDAGYRPVVIAANGKAAQEAAATLQSTNPDLDLRLKRIYLLHPTSEQVEKLVRPRHACIVLIAEEGRGLSSQLLGKCANDEETFAALHGEQGLAAGLSAVQEGVGTGIVVGAGGRDAHRAVKAVMASDPTLRIHLLFVDRYGTDTRELRLVMRRHDLPCGVLVLPASPGRWRLVGVGQCVSAPASESFQRVVTGAHGLAVAVSAIQELVGTKVLVAAEGREARKAVESLIDRRPGLQIAPLYLRGDGDHTRRVRKEMLRHNLACGLRVLPFSSTQWKIIGVGECGEEYRKASREAPKLC